MAATASREFDATLDPALESWVESANAADADFPIQNLPFGRFRTGADAAWRIGVAIGDQVLDLQRAGLVEHSDMARLLQVTPRERRALRAALSAGLRRGSADRARFEAALLPMSDVTLGLPCDTRDYTDFFIGIHHATTCGRLFRPDNPLMPNYKWVPIGYHGRASTLRASGVPFHRPRGQLRGPVDTPVVGPSQRMDFELELGVVIGRPNEGGEPIAMADAESHVFGITLLNDWSARDVQSWESQPLGPFLAKNFASTLSPWMVTLEALQPFRVPFERPAGDPQPLPYLDSDANRAEGAFSIELEAWVQTPRMRAAGEPGACIARSNFADAAYWTVAQLVAHHTVNGCELGAGDLFGTGTLSGPQPEQAACLLELTMGGRNRIALPNGESRTFLEDGDTVILRAYCSKPGFRRIGFGECRATLLPARD